MITESILLLVLLVLFLVGWAWAWSPRRRADFDAAAMLPLDDAPPANIANTLEDER